MAKAAAPTLDRQALNRAMLARQLLLARSDAPIEDALEHVGGLQAQWPKPPYIGLWTRLAGFERGALGDALRARTAVRATLHRGTIHLVSARDYVAWRGLFQPMLTRG